jgi:hypothetical protein
MKLLCSLLLIAPLTSPLPTAAQDVQEPPTPDELVMRQFRPRHIATMDLFQAAQDTLSRSIFVRDARTNQGANRSNMQMLADAIVVYDLPPNVERILATFGELDEQYGAEAPRSGGAAFRTEEYTPGHLSLRAAQDALQPYFSSLDGEGGRNPFQNINFVKERGTLVIRDVPERVDEVLRFLARIDVPRPQVLLTAYLVRASDEPGEAGQLPEELVRGLAPLVGAAHLTRQSLAMMRTSVEADRELSLLLQSEQLGSYELLITPAAYDVGRGSLSLSSCALLAHNFTGLQDGTRLFTTQTSISTNEFTVLGASGPSPIYVVLHAQALAR